MPKRGTSWVASEPLEILIRIEADDMNFDGAIGVAQSPLQQSTILAQQREYGCLVGLKAGNPVRRYARNQDERQACRSCAPSEDIAPFQEVWRRYYRRGGISSTMSARVGERPLRIAFPDTRRTSRYVCKIANCGRCLTSSIVVVVAKSRTGAYDDRKANQDGCCGSRCELGG